MRLDGDVVFGKGSGAFEAGGVGFHFGCGNDDAVGVVALQAGDVGVFTFRFIRLLGGVEKERSCWSTLVWCYRGTDPEEIAA